MKEILERLCAGADLSMDETHTVFCEIVRGDHAAPAIAGLLIALKAKGESLDEIAGAASALRQTASHFPRPEGIVADCAGTGGDGAHTFNISTAAALVAAAAGVRIAKHGNRAVSSRSGSADVLTQLGIETEAEPEKSAAQLEAHGFCYLHAPRYHSGLRHAAPARAALGTRTLMNVLGPLVNPARPNVQLVGVYAPALVEPVARILNRLGCERGLVVHGGGMDELAIHAPTQAVLLDRGKLETLLIAPEAAGVLPAEASALAGGGPETNAEIVVRTLSGTGPAAHRDVVAMNAGAVLWLAEAAPDLLTGTRLAREVLRDGAAARLLERLRSSASAVEPNPTEVSHV